MLREPLETGQITVSRAARQADFPASFQLVAAMNPCPCGYLGDSDDRCRCTPDQVARYRGRISGPLLDRIDLQLTVPRVDSEALLAEAAPETEGSAVVRERVIACRARQLARQGKPNARLSVPEVEALCVPDTEARKLLETAMVRLRLSARAYHRALKVARTLADLAGQAEIGAAAMAEALRYRELDRGN